MEKIGFDGFEWEEIQIDSADGKGRKRADIYLYIHDKVKQTYVKAEYFELAGITTEDRLHILAQGSAILMLKKQNGGPINIKSAKGNYCRIGGADLTTKLYNRCHTKEFEIVEATDGYVMFRPIRG